MRISVSENLRIGLTASFAAISLASVFLVIFSFMPGQWISDLATQFRLVFCIVFLICILALVLLKARIFALICVVGFILNAGPILCLYGQRPCEKTDKALRIKVLNFNTEFQHNDEYARFLQMVQRCDVDIIALVELNQRWVDEIEPALRKYPYRKIQLTGPGMAIFSKFPLGHCDVKDFGKSHHPRIYTEIILDSITLNLCVAHPTTPKSESGYIERNRELALISKEFLKARSPKILIGDLNCGPWSSAFQNLLKSGLCDSQLGFGAQPSWPARSGRILQGVAIPPFVPIDHVLVSSDICVKQRKVGPVINSDHLPVFVELEIPK